MTDDTPNTAPSLESVWQSYRADVIPADAGPIQVEECRRAFYAGAAGFYSTGSALAINGDPDPIDTLRDELVAFEPIVGRRPATLVAMSKAAEADAKELPTPPAGDLEAALKDGPYDLALAALDAWLERDELPEPALWADVIEELVAYGAELDDDEHHARQTGEQVGELHKAISDAADAKRAADALQ